MYCESKFIRWHQFSWFLQETLIHGFLNCISFDFDFRGLSEPRYPRKLEPHD